MSTDHHTIAIHFAKTLIAAAERNHLDIDILLEKADLNREMLTNSQLRITANQFGGLMHALWQAGDDELMGMAGVPSRYGVFAMMAKQAVRCRTLRSALYHLCKFYSLVAPGLELTFIDDGVNTRVTTQLNFPEHDPDHTLREFLMLVWHRFASWLVGQRIPLSHIDFEYPQPEHVAEYRLMYPCPARFQQPTNSLVLPSSALGLPVIQTPDSLRSYLRNAPVQWFQRQAYFPVFTRKVIDYLEESQHVGESSMDNIADELHMTTRTLRRKLAEEQTTFQELKDRVRRDHAIHQLSRPALSIAQISRELGFSEPAAFTRAFKQWTGVPPSSYRGGAKA
ncbi:AraC family transcriptional regulator [Neptunomonas sp. XY-337]|uniref:AraC family transcriptional regulator n=1 Tax=Neptunomonas sp. XY-337 TaxID=2561897 RepID=UPI0010AAB2AE|nr:AraC family transcriptional regulator [Neptunomonas sp. XY-337]